MDKLTKPFVPPQRLNSGNKNVTKTESKAPKYNIGLRKANTPYFRSNQSRISISSSKQDAGSPKDTNSLSKIELCYILYRKKSAKKNKSWILDAYGVITFKRDVTHNFQSHKKLTVKVYNSESGNFIGGLSLVDDDNDTGISTFGNFEFLFSHYINSADEKERALSIINKSKSKTSECTENDVSDTTDVSIYSSSNHTEQQSSQNSSVNSQNKDQTVSDIQSEVIYIDSNDEDIQNTSHNDPSDRNIKRTKLNSSILSGKFVLPIKTDHNSNSHINTTSKRSERKSLYDKSKIENALIMNKKNPEKDIDVIVDPSLSSVLREHQRAGVSFMYDCVMNVKSDDISGCLLADEMGLGKTLMSITLIWTLLQQTPCPIPTGNIRFGAAAIRKAIIVCPVSLISNWKAEFNKWLGMKIGVKILNTRSGNNSAEKDKMEFENFINIQRVHKVIIISYEKVLSLKSIFESKGFNDKVDLLVCDEAHKLKNNNSKVLQILKNVDFKKKVLLTGTPIQNDLQEFFTICDFLNPGILGNLAQFKKKFIIPISKARNTESRYNKEISALGEEMSSELIEETSRFILRRTNDILNKFLPSKSDYIIFCKPTDEQVSIIENILGAKSVATNITSTSSSLNAIQALKKICNAPRLVSGDSILKSSGSFTKSFSNDSGKLRVLNHIVGEIKQSTKDKIVIISNYTQTLDIIQDLLKYKHMISFTRLDGSTPAKERHSIVKEFNNNSYIRVFLLSAKSGGMGLNLVGANRLILFDNDWNPAIDQQAMGRIHRDGQKKKCYIYRLVTTGMIDEKILQRQVTKISLSKKILNDSNSAEISNSKKESKNDSDIFDMDDLKDLFTIKKDTRSNTHDLICQCPGDGVQQDESENILSDDELSSPSQEVHLDKFISGSFANDVLEKLNHQREKEKKRLMKQCFEGYGHFDFMCKNHHELYDQVLNSINREDITFILEKKADTMI